MEEDFKRLTLQISDARSSLEVVFWERKHMHKVNVNESLCICSFIKIPVILIGLCRSICLVLFNPTTVISFIDRCTHLFH